MTVSEEAILKVLRIARDHSRVGTGESLRDLLGKSGYATLRASLTSSDIKGVLASHPELALDWASFSEDKRTSGGYALVRNGPKWGIYGRHPDGSPLENPTFDDLESACAEYVLLELDFWTQLGSKPPHRAA